MCRVEGADAAISYVRKHAVDNGYAESVRWKHPMLESLLQSNLTRKQFLLAVVSLMVGVIGLKHLLQQTKSSPESVPSTFSSGPYGGW